MKQHIARRAGFTLIELLVVITIIGILAGIALPVYSSIQERGNQTKALSQAKQIGLALKLFAGDNDGNFPQNATESGGNVTTDFATAPANANIAYKQLIPDYVNGEKIFYVPRSAWTPNQPDEQIGTFAQKLAVNENHWAYVPRLNDTSNPSYPLVADGFSTSVGAYTDNPANRGGVWKGKKAIVIRVDQSGALENVRASDFKVFGRTGGAAAADIFLPASWTPALPAAPVNPPTS